MLWGPARLSPYVARLTAYIRVYAFTRSNRTCQHTPCLRHLISLTHPHIWFFNNIYILSTLIIVVRHYSASTHDAAICGRAQCGGSRNTHHCCIAVCTVECNTVAYTRRGVFVSRWRRDATTTKALSSLFLHCYLAPPGSTTIKPFISANTLVLFGWCVPELSVRLLIECISVGNNVSHSQKNAQLFFVKIKMAVGFPTLSTAMPTLWTRAHTQQRGYSCVAIAKVATTDLRRFDTRWGWRWRERRRGYLDIFVQLR